jgi:hypothetical protein
MPPTPFSSKNPYNSAKHIIVKQSHFMAGRCRQRPYTVVYFVFCAILFFMENSSLMRKTPFFANFIDFV